MKEENQFALAKLNFTQLKTIKDACDLAGKQGVDRAKEIAEELNKLLEDVSV